MPSETASEMATTSSAPLRCAISAAAPTSSMVPKKFGDWIRTQAVVSVTACSSAFRSTRPFSRKPTVVIGTP